MLCCRTCTSAWFFGKEADLVIPLSAEILNPITTSNSGTESKVRYRQMRDRETDFLVVRWLLVENARNIYIMC